MNGMRCPTCQSELTMSDTDPTDTGPSAEPLRYVFCIRPRCPKCGSAELLTYRSTKHEDGATSRRTFCRACEYRFIVVWE